MDAEARATAQTLFKNGRPVRQIHLAKVDEFHMGALMMHFMLETIIMGRLMGWIRSISPAWKRARFWPGSI